MSAFQSLKEVSNSFEAELKKLSSELFTVKIGDSVEETISNKVRDLTLFTSKLRFLRAKPVSNNPQIANENHDEYTTLQSYEDTASAKVLEQQIIKFLTQSSAVKSLITSPDSTLNPDLVERKQNILNAFTQYSHMETQLRQLDSVLKQKEEELARVRDEWDQELGEVRDMRDRVEVSRSVESGPLESKLRTLIGKMELMRWLISKLVTSRTGRYDWMADPHSRLHALKVARERNTLENFLES